MSNNHTPDEQRDLDEAQATIDAAKAAAEERSKKVDDLTTRFKVLRRKNHFRLMLEELFND